MTANPSDRSIPPVKSDSEKSGPNWRLIAVVILSLFAVCLMGWRGYQVYQDKKLDKAAQQPYSRFWSDVAAGQVARMEMSSDFLGMEADVKLKDGKKYKVAMPHLDAKDSEEIAKKGIELEFKASSTDYGRYISMATSLLILAMLGLTIAPALSGAGGFRKTAKPTTRFTDVAGADEAKEALQDIVHYLRDPKAFETLGAKFPRGVMMYGDPGTGKTLLARAVAGEAGAAFFSVSGSDFSSMFVGVSGMKVRGLFRKARKMAPCILFIDEIDAIGGSRLSEGTATAREMGSTLNQLLVQMDGFDQSSGVVVIAATNRLDMLDAALLRPGRFDRKIYVPTPSLREREAILKIHTANVKTADGFDHQALARATTGMSGSDLANLINQAAIKAAKEQADSVTLEHALKARDMIIMGEARQGLSESLDEHTKKVLAAHEAGHALTALVLGPDPVTRVSIIPRGPALGVTMMSPTQDRFLVDDEHLKSQLCVLLGGRAAEQLAFRIRTTGARDDLSRASRIAREMVAAHGMSEFGLLSVSEQSSDHTKFHADKLASEIMDEAMAKATQILTANREIFDSIADALLEREEIDEADLNEIVNRHGGLVKA